MLLSTSPSSVPWVRTAAGRALTRLLIVILVVQGWPLWELRQAWQRERIPWPRVLNHVVDLWLPPPVSAAVPAPPRTNVESKRPQDLSSHVSRPGYLDPHVRAALRRWGGSRSVVPVSHRQPSGSAIAIFGPKDYLRAHGKPAVVTETFTLTDLLTHVTLRIDNGGRTGQYARVSSAVVTLNGVVVVAPHDFNPHVAVIEKAITLTRENVLRVEVRSKPGSGFTLQILGTVPNHAPVAQAGPDQTARAGQTVFLDGSRSSDADGDTLAFRWQVVTRPPDSQTILADPQTVHPSLTVDTRGTYAVQLIVHDGHVDSLADMMIITTENSPPVAHAGAPQTVVVGTTVTLDGSFSSDVDGDLLTFTWVMLTQPPSSQAALSAPQAVKPTFVVDAPGIYTVQLLVHDGQLASAPATVEISTRNSPPVARAGLDQAVFVGEVVQLDGSTSSDVDGDSLTYHWALTTRPPDSQAVLADPLTIHPTLTIDVPGMYVAQLLVHDGHTESLPDTVTIRTLNTSPMAQAGADQTGVVGQTIQLDGSQSRDRDGDPLTYRWSVTSLPAESTAVLSDTLLVTPTLQLDRPGLYVVQLIVNDGQVDSAPDTVVISTENSPPVANAGPDQQVTVGDTVTLDGRGSSDVDDDFLLYQWAFLTRPVDSMATLSDALAPQPTFIPDLAGLYVLQLIVSDSHEASPPDTMTVTAGQPNRPPVITSTPLTTATVGESYSYDVDATDPDAGETLTFALTTAPSGMTIDATTGVIQWTPTSTQVGNQPVTVQVHDTGGLAATQSFMIAVPQPNRPPLITSLPGTTATADQPYSYAVAATDPDVGDVLTFALTTLPAGMTINPSTGLIQWTPTATQVGSITVTIDVRDSQGLSALQQYQVTVRVQEDVDLAVVAVDASAVTTTTQTLVIGGTVQVAVQNRQSSPFNGQFEVLLFADCNPADMAGCHLNGTFDRGVDTVIGTASFSGSMASQAVVSLAVPVSAVVAFRDTLLHTRIDSINQVPTPAEAIPGVHSGQASKFRPPLGDFQPKVKWQWETPFHTGIFHTPLVAPLVDTNGDGLVNERDIPAVIAVPVGVDAPLALRGDTGQVLLPGAPGATRHLFDGHFDHPAVGDLDGDGRPEIIVAAQFWPLLLQQ